jgi:hypothetical protein
MTDGSLLVWYDYVATMCRLSEEIAETTSEALNQASFLNLTAPIRVSALFG